MDTLKVDCPKFQERTIATLASQGKGMNILKVNVMVFLMKTKETISHDKVVTRLFDINYTYVNVLFDLGTNSSLVSITFISLMTELVILFLITIAFLR